MLWIYLGAWRISTPDSRVDICRALQIKSEDEVKGQEKERMRKEARRETTETLETLLKWPSLWHDTQTVARLHCCPCALIHIPQSPSVHLTMNSLRIMIVF